MRFDRTCRQVSIPPLAALMLGFLPLAGCGGSAPETPAGPTAQQDKIRDQMLEYDKVNGLSKKARR